MVNIEVGRLLKIHTTKKIYSMGMMQEIGPYVNIPNQAIITNLNLGLSIKDVIPVFNLAKVDYVNNDEEVIITMPVGLWDFIKDLPTIKFGKVKYLIPNIYPTTNAIQKATQIMVGDYKYQKTAVLKMLEYNNGILEAGPGSGKTIMGLTLGRLKGKSILWINDRIELAKQAYNTAVNILGFEKEDCGLLQGDKEHISKYTFTTIQKLTKVLNRGFNSPTQQLRQWDVIIIDECHHAIGSYNSYSTYFQVLNEVKYNYLYGLTATVQRVDGNEHLVYALLGPVRYTEESKTKTIPAEVVKKTISIKTTEEEYYSMVNKYTGKVMPAASQEFLLFNDQYINAVTPYINSAIKNYNKVLIVSPRVAGAQMWSDYLTEQNIDHFLVYGAVKKRDKLYTSKVLVATLDLIKEGFDVVDLECVLVLSTSLHEQVLIQVIGRVERWAENKKQPKAYILNPRMSRYERKRVPSAWKEMNVNEFFK